MFVWVFHRISGLLLIVLVALQLVTGFFRESTSDSELVEAIAALHKNATLNCLTVFFFIFHALYGVRTILMDLGVKAERLLFWACTILGLVGFGVFLVLFFTLVSA